MGIVSSTRSHRGLVTGFCILVLILSIAFLVFRILSANAASAVISEDVAMLEELRTAHAEVAERAVDVGRDAVAGATGLDFKRRSRDFESARRMFARAFTWSGVDGYERSRHDIVSEDGVPKSCQFLTEFMPSVMEGHDGANMSYVDMDPVVTAVSPSKYSYLAEVEVASVGPTGAQDSTRVLVLWDVDADGKFTDVVAYRLV